MSSANGANGSVQIVARDLHKTYRMGDSEIHALDDVSLDIRAGEYLAVTGASGSGKSTLMNLIGALDQPTRGGLTVDGTDLTSLDADGLARYRNATIGFVFQQFNLLPRTSALDNVALPLLYSATPAAEACERASISLDRVGLGKRKGHQPSELSGGQQQRVALARALVNQPKIILADEPTGALDSHTTEEIVALFESLNNDGITIVMVTHEPEIAARARRRVAFRDGRIVEDSGHSR